MFAVRVPVERIKDLDVCRVRGGVLDEFGEFGLAGETILALPLERNLLEGLVCVGCVYGVLAHVADGFGDLGTLVLCLECSLFLSRCTSAGVLVGLVQEGHVIVVV